jgi:hypothetical protein
MRRLMMTLVVGLLGCGGPEFIEPRPGRGVLHSAAKTLPGPWSYCVTTCTNVREQLIRDFAILPEQIDCLHQDFQQATDCQSCGRVLERWYGVLPTTCR